MPLEKRHPSEYKHEEGDVYTTYGPFIINKEKREQAERNRIAYLKKLQEEREKEE